jgi:DNA-binding NtrC family response regulator
MAETAPLPWPIIGQNILITNHLSEPIQAVKNLVEVHKGTAFLDEIGDLSLPAHAKILRVLEQAEVQPLGSSAPKAIDIRFVTATNQSLEEFVSKGRFRADLFFRLNVIRIHIPPLRERREDIPQIATHLLRRYIRGCAWPAVDLTPGAHVYLLEQLWPGNARELRNLLEAALALCNSERITENHLFCVHRLAISAPPIASVQRSTPTPMFVTRHTEPSIPGQSELCETKELHSALEATNWNKSKAAELLNCSRMTVYRKIRKYHFGATESSAWDGDALAKPSAMRFIGVRQAYRYGRSTSGDTLDTQIAV